MDANARLKEDMLLDVKSKLAPHQEALNRLQSVLFWTDAPSKIQFVILCVACHLILG